MEGEIGQQVVEFSSLFRRAAEDSYVALRELVERSKSSEQPDSEKKIDLLKYILKTRQRMLRLHVLAKWCKQAPLVQYCQQLASTLSSHDTCFTQAADSLFFMHEGLQQARAPIYDVPSAIEVMLTGSYQKLPKCIEDFRCQSTLTEEEQEPVLKQLDTLLRSRLLDISLPKEISKVKVSDGTLLLTVDGEFEVLLTLGYRGHLSLWRILHLKMLVGEKIGPVKLEETRRYALGDDLERRMAASENPFSVLYSILHEFSVALVMDTLIRQSQVLRQGRWRDAIRFELISDSSSWQSGNVGTVQVAQDGEPDSGYLKTPGLKIVYWLDSDRNTAGADPSLSPFIKIEPGADLQIKCFHSAFVLDPLSDTEAEFTLDQGCIDVEKLILRAIACNRHTRLLEIHKELCKNTQIYQAEGDVILQRQGVGHYLNTGKEDAMLNDKEYWTDEVLQVRAYGSMYITLGINIRNGRFRLHSSKNVFEESVLVDSEEALNQGTMTAAEAFISLRSKSILHLFASTGRFLGLKVYEQGLTTLKIPKFILDGSDTLVLGFPQLGTSYFLMVQLDKDFKPLLRLLETRPDSGGGSNCISENCHVICYNKIDAGQMELAEDELNLSLLNWEKLCTVISKRDSTESPEHALIHDKALEPLLQLTGSSKSGFSSLVDEVFDLEKGSAAPMPNRSHLRSLNASTYSHINSNQGVKGGYGSPKKEGLQYSYANNNSKNSSSSPTLSNSSYQANNMKPLYQNGPFNSFNQLKSSPESLSRSKSDQEVSSIRSPYSGDGGHGSCLDDEQTKSTMSGSRGFRQLSPLRTSASQLSVGHNKQNGPKTSGGSPYMTKATCQALASPESGNDIVLKQSVNSRKRGISDILPLIPTLREMETVTSRKRRKLLSPTRFCTAISQAHTPPFTGRISKYTYGRLLAETNNGLSPSSMYLTSLLHVIRHCSLCIKHAQLTGQMDALGIPYVEEVGLRTPSSSMWFRVPFAKDNSWQRLCLRLGKPGSMSWDVKVNDPYFKELWVLQKGSASTTWGSGVRIANASDVDLHIHYHPEGIILSYKTVESDSIKKLVSDLQRLFNARMFACGMRKLLKVKSDEVSDGGNVNSESKSQLAVKATAECNDKISEQIRKAFKIEAVGLMSLWFYYGSMPIMAHFVVEWEAGKEGCTMHVSPDQLWPHTKFLEDFVNGGEVASFLDCVRLTAGPLLALGTAIRPARMPAAVASGPSPVPRQNAFVQSQGVTPTSSSSNANQPASSCTTGSTGIASLGSHNLHNTAMLSAAGRGGPGIVPSSLLPIDVSVVLRGPYWIRIIYRKKFAVDMRCYAGDQVWLQPATPPKGGPSAGGSLPCPQFRPFIMEHVAQGLNAMEPSFSGNAHSVSVSGVGSSNSSTTAAQMPNGNRGNVSASVGVSRPTTVVGGQGLGGLSRVGNAMLASSSLAAVTSGLPIRISPGTGVPVHVKGELNTAFIGLGDDGGYGGGWVPLAALKKVLRGILKYLGVLWLFAQLPELLKDILGSILKENEGALLNLDQDQPALRFFVGGYVFAVSVHRVQLLLQVLSVKRFHHQQQQQQQQQTQSNSQEELASSEIIEICDYFSRRVASEPYDASRVASFITLLTLPVSVLREFLKLIAWEKGLSHAQGGDTAPTQRPRVELCLETHSGVIYNENTENSSVTKSNIHHDRANNSVDYALTFVLDHALIPHVNAAGGAAWLPYCVSIRLKFLFGDSAHISLMGMEGSHGGRACWSRLEDWEKCKQRVARAVDFGSGNSAGDVSQGRLRLAAETLQRTLQGFLQQLRDSATSAAVAT